MMFESDEKCFELGGHGVGVGGDADDELDVLGIGKAVKPSDESDEGFNGLVTDELIKIVDIKMRDVIIAGVNAANETLEEFIGADVIAAGVDKARLIGNVISQLALFLDDHDVAIAVADGLAHEINQLFCLAGALETHNKLNHFVHSPCKYLVC